MIKTQCQNCKQVFTLLDDDLAMYAKFNVPNETYCSDCRMQQLMMWRNERSLYSRKDMNGKNIISIYSPSAEATVLDQNDWWKDDWDPLEYGRDYDFSKPFFVQFQELLKIVPLISVFNDKSENSDYTNHVAMNKNCYLIFASAWSEDSAYSRMVTRGKDCIDILQGEDIERCYDVIDCQKCYNLFYSQQSVGCNDSYFLYNCRNCTDCVGCVNLRNKSYCIFNEQYTKAEYEDKLKELNLGKRSNIEALEKKFRDFILKFPHQFAHLVNSENVIGDYISNAKDCYHCFSIYENSENLRYVTHAGWDLKDATDSYGVGLGELMYKVLDGGVKASKIMCMMVERGGFETSYGFYCHESSNLFGCVGLRKKQYCILNKQYTKEEYEALLPKVIQHMKDMPYTDAKGRKYGYGDFFPVEISFYAYNETVAQEYYPLTKEEALAQGYRWKDQEQKAVPGALKAKDLPEEIAVVQDDVLQKVIECEHAGTCNEQCTTVFKMIPFELKFYRDHNIPLPKFCPNCRHHQRFAKRNPMKLWHRQCVCDTKVYKNSIVHEHHKDKPCQNEFESSYEPSRQEIVYCEQCYNAEVA